MTTDKILSQGDIDIDVYDRSLLLELIDYTSASIIKDDTITNHNTGIYVQDIPIDPITGLSSLDYERAEELGYVKLDILNMSAYQKVRDEEHLIKLVNQEPLWSLLEHEEIVKTLPHIHNHFDIVSKLKPISIEQLAMVLAIIRPGKRKLSDKSWAEIEKNVWIKEPGEKFVFKKAHAIAYSLLIAVCLNLLVEENE